METNSGVDSETPRDPALDEIDVSTMRGLEIGPLYRPRVAKAEGPVYYIDHATTEGLREKYTANAVVKPHLHEIVDVDFVIRDGCSLREAAGDAAPFDYVIASHVVEHIANPIGWLGQVADVLHPGGVLSLVVPDKRFCFDVTREKTRMRDWIDWHLRGLTQPKAPHIYGFFADVATIDGVVDTAGLWAGTANYEGVRRTDVDDPDQAALDMCLREEKTGEYIDVHCGVYSPSSFLHLLQTTARLDLQEFELASFTTTPVDTLEFYITLRFVPTSTPGLRAASYEHTRVTESELEATREKETHSRLRAELTEAQAQRAVAEQAAWAANNTVENITGSISWRATEPVRQVVRRLRQIRRG